jgi:hypothetical protein
MAGLPHRCKWFEDFHDAMRLITETQIIKINDGVREAMEAELAIVAPAAVPNTTARRLPVLRRLQDG